MNLSDYARRENLRPPDASDMTTGIGRCQHIARATSVASYALSEGARLEIATEPGRALSATEAASAAGRGLEVVVTL